MRARHHAFEEQLAVVAGAFGGAGYPQIVFEQLGRGDCLGQLDRAAGGAPADPQREHGQHGRPVAPQTVRERLVAEVKDQFQIRIVTDPALVDGE